MKKILCSVAEVSADLHASHLASTLKKLDPSIYLFGMGGEKMRAAGVDIRLDMTAHSSVGISEALPHVFPMFRALQVMTHLLREEKPDLLLLVDAQGFNMPLAQRAKQMGISTAYYIAPQEWLWGTPRGVAKVVQATNLILAIFQKEAETYQKAGGNVVYVGHPLLDIVPPKRPQTPDHRPQALSLFPGSRVHEVKKLLPLLLESARRLRERIPSLQCFLSLPSEALYNKIKLNRRGAPTKVGVRLRSDQEDAKINVKIGQPYGIMQASDVMLAASGTVLLEACLLEVPTVSVYNLSPLSFLIAKYVLHLDRKLAYYTMPNLLLQEELVPELVQKNATPEKVVEAALLFLEDPARREAFSKGCQQLRKHLGEPGAIQRAAEAIVKI